MKYYFLTREEGRIDAVGCIATVVFLLIALSACSGSKEVAPADPGPALDIEQPPSGSLSPEQLEAIAADIRRLEARPLAPGAEAARRNLFMWVQGSPDVRVSLCGGIIGPLLKSESRYQNALLMQFILSSAAHAIENPGADAVAVNVGGLEGALATYHRLKRKQGRQARDSFMESLSERSKSGSFESCARTGLTRC